MLLWNRHRAPLWVLCSSCENGKGALRRQKYTGELFRMLKTTGRLELFLVAPWASSELFPCALGPKCESNPNHKVRALLL